MGLAACGGGDPKANPGDTDNNNTAKCSPDDFNTLTETRNAVEGTEASDTICPQQDEDYWLITGAGGDKKLLNVNLEYDKLSQVELQADVWGPRGRCMPNALTTCTDASQCAGDTSFCDTTRGACRSPTAAVCYSNPNCAAGEQCYGTTSGLELLGQVHIDPSDAFQHKLNANYAAFEQGNYVVVVYDHAQKEADAKATYKLTVSETVDSDANEPNDLPNQATALTNNTGISGAMSYVGDTDWFQIEPLNPSGGPTIIKVDLRYPASSAIAPNWTIIQGDGQYVGPPKKTVGQGGSATVQQAAAVVNLGTGTIYVKIENDGTNVNTADRYTLTVQLTQDADESTNRNDVVTTATQVNGDVTGNHYIVATNDFDWYQLNRPSAAHTNSLVNISATAPANAPYSLVVQYWRETTTTCDAQGNCPQGNPCDAANKCLDLMVQRPDPDDAHGDPQVGGRAPNHLVTQQPIFGATPTFIRITNNPSTTLPIDGYDNKSLTAYALAIAFKDEPDSVDGDDPDNKFVGRTAQAGVNEGDFRDHYRDNGPVTLVSGTIPEQTLTGYLSYDGDQDFFSITPATAMAAGGVEIEVTMPGPSPVDIRVSAVRQGTTVGWPNTQDDFSGGGCQESGSTADTLRMTCTFGGPQLSGPVPDGSTDQCSHTDVTQLQPITVWVNDVDSNDWDIASGHAYTIKVNYVLGCTLCPGGNGSTCPGM